jgi:hypothetical protein
MISLPSAARQGDSIRVEQPASTASKNAARAPAISSSGTTSSQNGRPMAASSPTPVATSKAVFTPRSVTTPFGSTTQRSVGVECRRGRGSRSRRNHSSA